MRVRGDPPFRYAERPLPHSTGFAQPERPPRLQPQTRSRRRPRSSLPRRISPHVSLAASANHPRFPPSSIGLATSSLLLLTTRTFGDGCTRHRATSTSLRPSRLCSSAETRNDQGRFASETALSVETSRDWAASEKRKNAPKISCSSNLSNASFFWTGLIQADIALSERFGSCAE